LTLEHWSSAAAQRSVSLIYGGSILGGLALSWVMDRLQRSGSLVPATAFAGSSAILLVLGWSLSSSLVYVLLGALGLAIGGGQFILPALAARLYPPALLATALSWIGALTRLGAVCGPLAGGWMLLAGWKPMNILMVLSLPLLLGAIAFAALAFAGPKRAGTGER
jgi:AAHS family 4-hydroxybenzoate transporter-like MFS transporter